MPKAGAGVIIVDLFRLSRSDSEWVLTWVELTCWERSVDVVHTEHLEGLEEHLAAVIEGVSSVVREALADEDVTIEASEARDSVDADAAE